MLSVTDIPVDLIDIDGNPRRDPGDLQELAASIRRRGVMQPIRVRRDGDDRYRLVFGQRRLLASRLAERPTIPAIVADDLDPAGEDLVDAVVENLQRADLNPIDEARAIQQLVDQGIAEKDIAVLFGRSSSHINNRLRILRCDPYVVGAVEAGLLPIMHAIIIAALPHRQQKVLAQRCVAEGWNQHRLEVAIRPERVVKPRETVKPQVDEPTGVDRITEALAGFTPKVPEPLARLLLWAMVEMDVFVQGRFEKRHPAGFRGENIIWGTVTHLPAATLSSELAQTLAELMAEYGSADVKAALPRKIA